VLWIQGGQFTSMGDPVPFAMRIFSTLNSTGPAADFFAIGIIFALPFCRVKNVWVWPLMTLLGCALLLTLVREAWVGLVVGVVIYLAVSPARFRTLPFLALYGALLVFLVAALPALLGADQNSDLVTSRISTFGDISHDDSAIARSEEIQNSLQIGLGNPIGRGLGQIGASAALSANPDTASGNSLDSGYLARLIELGWLGFCGYVFVVIGSFVALLTALFRLKRDSAASVQTGAIIAAAAAICAMLVWSDAASDVHLGLEGLLFWVALGIGLRRQAPVSLAPARKFR
jgi:putative inorganic carbon (HCO3(-)) transporter